MELSLEFTNTVVWRGRQDRTDFWKDAADLSDWLAKHGLLSDESAVDTEEFDRTVTFREALFGVLESICKERSPPEADVAKVQEEVSIALSRVRLVQDGKSFSLKLQGAGDFESALNAIALSAADLLTSVEQGRLRVCANDECGWVFIDSSKNRSRRWCSMAFCGNTAKAKRFYEKKKSTKE